jgi:pyoverdine/dityrosine biosynthesis protein Dit1
VNQEYRFVIPDVVIRRIRRFVDSSIRRFDD